MVSSTGYGPSPWTSGSGSTTQPCTGWPSPEVAVSSRIGRTPSSRRWRPVSVSHSTSPPRTTARSPGRSGRGRGHDERAAVRGRRLAGDHEVAVEEHLAAPRLRGVRVDGQQPDGCRAAARAPARGRRRGPGRSRRPPRGRCRRRSAAAPRPGRRPRAPRSPRGRSAGPRSPGRWGRGRRPRGRAGGRAATAPPRRARPAPPRPSDRPREPRHRRARRRRPPGGRSHGWRAARRRTPGSNRPGSTPAPRRRCRRR